jgi:hypothetical protein
MTPIPSLRWSHALPQPHARPAAVLGDELDAGRFEGAAKNIKRGILRRGLAAFEISDRRISNPRGFGELLL